MGKVGHLKSEVEVLYEKFSSLLYSVGGGQVGFNLESYKDNTQSEGIVFGK